MTGRSKTSLRALAYDYLDDHWPEAWPEDDWIGDTWIKQVWGPAFEDFLLELEAAVDDRFTEWSATYQPGQGAQKEEAKG